MIINATLNHFLPWVVVRLILNGSLPPVFDDIIVDVLGIIESLSRIGGKQTLMSDNSVGISKSVDLGIEDSGTDRLFNITLETILDDRGFEPLHCIIDLYVALSLSLSCGVKEGGNDTWRYSDTRDSVEVVSGRASGAWILFLNGGGWLFNEMSPR